MDQVRLLVIEDDPDDAELLRMHLNSANFDAFCHRVDSPEALHTALSGDRWDAVICDHSLPGFTGVEALAWVKAAQPDLPFLFVSGTIREDVAISCMRQGAQDYLMKGNLNRLVPALRRELAEAAVRKAHRVNVRRSRQIVDHASDGIWILDELGIITYANDRFSRLLGLDAEEVLGRQFLEFVDSADLTAVLARGPFLLEGPSPFPCQLRGKNGLQIVGVISVAPLADGSCAETTLGMVVDVTQLKDLELQLLQAQKLEALGRLSSGIAHDFNNLLSVILGFSDLLLDDSLNDGSTSRTGLQEIRKAALRGAALTKQLLAIGRRQAGLAEIVCVHHQIHDLLPMLTRVLGPDVSLHLRLGAVDTQILMDQTHLCQIILNLVINARDAMPQGGTIHLVTENPRPQELLLSISDTGTGIPDDILSQIWSPFFTTKGVDKGTGLGLSTVRRLVEMNQGTIDVKTEAGKGTGFFLSWPLTSSARLADLDSDGDGLPACGGETILVVEDSEDVREMLVGLLLRFGYRVLAAEQADGAFALLANLSDPIDLIVADIMLPGLKGPELVNELRRRQPGLRALLISGFGPEQMEDLESTDEFLEKPFTQTQFLQKVTAILGTSAIV
ncbi:MAG: response regulator [Candidatus Eremiobacteraeota bacterium]|nr:response regulator [Candidatus Eremiobacteraeota bacterium]MCW5870724.1 response regulator [Candidatus Eremiobacteraeota bacterium]